MIDTEVVVVGAGVMGLSAAWRLADAGRSVVVLERFATGHEQGSSHGPTRIFRYVYDHPRYVAMARAALPLWRELESSRGELLRITGGIDGGDRDGLERCARALGSEGEAFEWLDQAALRARYPWCEIDGPVLASPDTGVIDAASTLERLRARALDAGAQLIEHCRVVSIEQDERMVVARGVESSVRARTAVVAAGAWTAPLLAQLGIGLPVRVTREHVYFVDGPPDTVPLIWRGERFFYSVPSLDGTATIKVGEHVGGTQVDPDDRTGSSPEPAALRAWTRGAIPAATEPGARAEECLYTITPDEDFVLDRCGRVIVVSACSGHGFKFAPLIGVVVERLVAGEPPPVPIEDFSIARF